MQTIRIKSTTGSIPRYAHQGDAGFDLSAASTVVVPAHGHVTVGTGIAMEIPQGFVGLVFPRSGLGCKHGIALRNCVGVIDSGYRGEIRVTLTNDNDKSFGVYAGDRICQMIIVPYAQCSFVVVDELEDTERGHKGYGSTGIQGDAR